MIPEHVRYILWTSPTTSGAVLGWQERAYKLTPPREVIAAPDYQKLDQLSHNPEVGHLVRRIRWRISEGRRPTIPEIRSLALWTSSDLCQHSSPKIRAEAARLLERCAAHAEQIKLGVMKEQGRCRRNTESLAVRVKESDPAPGLLGSGQGGSTAPRLRLPRVS